MNDRRPKSIEFKFDQPALQDAVEAVRYTAGYKAGLEAAAKVCENVDTRGVSGYGVAKTCAAAVRALAPAPADGRGAAVDEQAHN